MSRVPEILLRSLEGVPGFDRKAFEQVHDSGEQVVSIRINPSKYSIADSSLPIAEKVPWSSLGYYLTGRPSFTFDPLFHAGCYYVQEASGMFLEQVLNQTVELGSNLKILDLCAAPGGKSTLIQSLVSPGSLLVSNELIKSRTKVLTDNIVKWGCNNVVVTNNDPRDFAHLQNYFDVIVVDAPCSGSGLFRRDPEAIEEWSISNVQLCCQRQERILADIFPALKNNGILIYSTCSYSEEENEEVLDWMADRFPIGALELSIKNEWGIVQSFSAGHKLPGYRFFPDKLKGEGFFIAAFKKKETTTKPVRRSGLNLSFASKNEYMIISQWVKQQGCKMRKHNNTIIAEHEELVHEIALLVKLLRVVYSGTRIGEIIRNKLIPDHALAMSRLVSNDVPHINLELEQAIQYLKKKEFNTKTDQKGWQLVRFKDHALGWVNALPNRLNNYYPKELRILKD